MTGSRSERSARAHRAGTAIPPIPAAPVGHGHRVPRVGPGRAVEVLQHGRVSAVRRLRPGFRRGQPGGPAAQHVAQAGQVHGGQPHPVGHDRDTGGEQPGRGGVAQVEPQHGHGGGCPEDEEHHVYQPHKRGPPFSRSRWPTPEPGRAGAPAPRPEQLSRGRSPSMARPSAVRSWRDQPRTGPAATDSCSGQHGLAGHLGIGQRGEHPGSQGHIGLRRGQAAGQLGRRGLAPPQPGSRGAPGGAARPRPAGRADPAPTAHGSGCRRPPDAGRTVRRTPPSPPPGLRAGRASNGPAWAAFCMTWTSSLSSAPRTGWLATTSASWYQSTIGFAVPGQRADFAGDPVPDAAGGSSTISPSSSVELAAGTRWPQPDEQGHVHPGDCPATARASAISSSACTAAPCPARPSGAATAPSGRGTRQVVPPDHRTRRAWPAPPRPAPVARQPAGTPGCRPTRENGPAARPGPGPSCQAPSRSAYPRPDQPGPGWGPRPRRLAGLAWTWLTMSSISRSSSRATRAAAPAFPGRPSRQTSRLRSAVRCGWSSSRPSTASAASAGQAGPPRGCRTPGPRRCVPPE